MIKKHENPTYGECRKALAKHSIKTESKRVIVAFVDVVGFGPWIKRAHALSDFHFLITQLYRKLIHFKENLGYHVKFLGDGGMILKEMSPGHNCGMAVKFMRDMECLGSFMSAVIKRTAWPRPEGFRIRMAAGHISKLMMKICERDCNFQTDYIGYPINMASRMLNIQKESTVCLCHESVKDIIGPKKAKSAEIVFKKLPKPRRTPTGIDVEDMDHLWEFFVGKGE